MKLKIILGIGIENKSLVGNKNLHEELGLLQAECLFMMGSLEKSLRYWHKAAKLRPNQEEVTFC